MSAFESGMRGSSETEDPKRQRPRRSRHGRSGRRIWLREPPASGIYRGRSEGRRPGRLHLRHARHEKPKQKSAAAATVATGNEAGGGSSKQGPNTSVGNPKGDNTAKSLGKSTDDSTLHAHGDRRLQPGEQLDWSALGWHGADGRGRRHAHQHPDPEGLIETAPGGPER
jgi:hypothetical protein